VGEKLDKLPNFSKWAAAVKANESVTYIFPEETFITHFKKRIEQRKAAAKV
jgi:glutathione S-transferase